VTVVSGAVDKVLRVHANPNTCCTSTSKPATTRRFYPDACDCIMGCWTTATTGWS
jgi:hypothetical protein